MSADYSFLRYLSSKKSVDDRALNRRVWDTLANNLPGGEKDRPLRILEVGCGIGTMLGRMADWKLFSHADYTGIDALSENIEYAPTWLDNWANASGFLHSEDQAGRWIIENQDRSITYTLIAADLFDFIAGRSGSETWDLLIAHAFLDLVDLPDALPRLLSLVDRNGWFYFTLNFDGLTSMQPEIDPALDSRIEVLYHRTMDEWTIGGKPSGDSRTGRHLFNHLEKAGVVILDAGPSDWIVLPHSGGYPQDEAYFLHFIIHTIHKALEGHPELDPSRFKDWVAKRHAQVERGELVYIAHQLDFVGRKKHLPGK